MTYEFKIHDFWLPPELWRECLRWATLPPSGRPPLHDAPTCVEPWSLSYPNDTFLFEGPDICYFYEQSALYPMKRRLPLVSKLWAALSIEFLYECIVLDQKRGMVDRLLVTLRQPNKGAELARFIKRIDIERDDSPLSNVQDLFITFLSILPELRVLRCWKDNLFQPLYITLEDQPELCKLNTLAVVPKAIDSINATSSDSELCWKALTISIDSCEGTGIPGELPILNRSMLRLKHLILKFNDIQESSFLSSLSRLQGWSLPCLTHLSFHLYSIRHRGAVKEVVDAFGKQLEFVALTGEGSLTGRDEPLFCQILGAAPNIKEFVFSPRRSDDINIDHLPPARYANVEVVGLPKDVNWGTQGFYWYTRLCAQAFPSLKIFRITGVVVPPNRERNGRQFNEWWVRRAAIDMRSKGIRLEDRTGRDLWEELGMAADEKEDEDATSESK